jgi:hypothetical protein
MAHVAPDACAQFTQPENVDTPNGVAVSTTCAGVPAMYSSVHGANVQPVLKLSSIGFAVTSPKPLPLKLIVRSNICNAWEVLEVNSFGSSVGATAQLATNRNSTLEQPFIMISTCNLL